MVILKKKKTRRKRRKKKIKKVYRNQSDLLLIDKLFKSGETDANLISKKLGWTMIQTQETLYRYLKYKEILNNLEEDLKRSI